MATAQEYHAVSNPSLGADPMASGIVVKEDQKKQQEELAHLATVLKSVEKELASTQSKAQLGSSPQETSGAVVESSDTAISEPLNGSISEPLTQESSTQGPSSELVKDVLAEMSQALQLLQVEIAKYAKNNASAESHISQAELTVAQDNLKKANADLQKLQKEEAKQKHLNFWMRFSQAFIGCIMTVVSAITFQPELLVAAALCFAGAGGLLQKATQALSSRLQLDGCSKALADILAGVIVTALVVVVTFGVGYVAGVDAGAASAADGAADAEESASVCGKIGSLLKKLNFFRKFSARTNLLIVAGAQAAVQTGLIGNLVGSLTYGILKAEKKKNCQKTEEEVEEITGVIVAVITTLATAGASVACGESAMNAAAEADISLSGLDEGASISARAFGRIRNFAVSSFGQKMFTALNFIGALGQVGTGTAAGGYKITQGHVTGKLATCNGDTSINNSAIEMCKSEMQSSQTYMAQREKQFDTSNRTIANLTKGQEAFAQLLCSSAV